MKLKSLFKSAVALFFVLGIFAACSNSPINSIVATINNYTTSVKNVTSIEEFQELNKQFAAQMNKYSTSDYELTSADRTALLKALTELSNASSAKVESIIGIQNTTSEAERIALLEKLVNDSHTLADLINGI